jgi:hemerythrin superfamily protein
MPSVASRKKSTSPNGARKSNGARAGATNKAPDAIKLLKSDHREVENLFAQFEKAKASERKKVIVTKICQALTVHATIEEEIFYPRAREALERGSENILDEAEVEHEGIKWRVEQLKDAQPGDDNYDARVTVLKEYVTHHVKEEERELFPKVKGSDLDTQAVGAELAARKETLTGKTVVEKPSMLERGLRAITGSANV